MVPRPKRPLRLFLLCLLSIVAFYGLLWLTPFRPSLPGYHTFFFTAKNYQKKKNELKITLQQTTADQHQLATLLQQTISDDFFPYWRGTRWGFNGTTQTPGSGRIACGYFVTTVLRDCGVPIARERCAQLASEKMIRELMQPENIKTYSHTSLTDFLKQIQKNGKQLYIVGLDSHVGFLSVEQEHTWFIHSSGRFPWAVVKEEANKSIVLEKSNYRVAGCLTTDEDFLKNWWSNVHQEQH